jgi:hypothetical protein
MSYENDIVLPVLTNSLYSKELAILKLELLFCRTAGYLLKTENNPKYGVKWHKK